MAQKHQWRSMIPAFEYCTDNAAMIAIAGHYKFINNELGSLNDLPFAR
jgi:N6-L-threonylcarbamoyladenine synthase